MTGQARSSSGTARRGAKKRKPGADAAPPLSRHKVGRTPTVSPHSEADTSGRMTAPAGYRSGFVAIVGRPNAGKSTLLNRVLGCKIAIVTPKPQTTRRRLLGIKTLPEAQVLFVDTPGIHRSRGLLNDRMVDQARQAVQDCDVALWMVDTTRPLDQVDREIASLIRSRGKKAVVALNKIDRGAGPRLLPIMQAASEILPDGEVIPVSALTGEGVDALVRALVERLPEGPQYYPAGEITDETERAIVAEIVREKVMLQTRDEVPYGVAVTVDAFEEKAEKNLVVIRATVHVERDSHKIIVVGQGGKRILAIGTAARVGIEALLGTRVFLELFVRVSPDWTRRAGQLKEFGL